MAMFLSTYCSLTTKFEMAPLAAAPRTARAPRSWPSELDRLDADDERNAYQANHEPQGLDAVYLRAPIEERGEERDEHRQREEHAGEARGYGGVRRSRSG